MSKRILFSALLALSVAACASDAAGPQAKDAPAAPATPAAAVPNAPLSPAAVSTASPAATPAAPKPAAVPAVAKVGQPAPLFTLDDQNGKPVNMADLKGKVIVLEWINKDCPIDQRVLNAKTMINLYAKYKDKVSWFAIDSTAAHTKADYAATITQFEIKYPLLNDAKGTVGHTYDAKTTPQMYIINIEGTLVYNGAIDDDPNGTKATKINYVDKALTELLAGKSIEISESKPYGCTVKY